MRGARYYIVQYRSAGVVAVVDQFDPASPTRSVTNDAENVIAELRADGYLATGPRGAPVRVIYRDTEGIWDELLVKDGRFAGFAPIRETTALGALDQIARSR